MQGASGALSSEHHVDVAPNASNPTDAVVAVVVLGGAAVMVSSGGLGGGAGPRIHQPDVADATPYRFPTVTTNVCDPGGRPV